MLLEAPRKDGALTAMAPAPPIRPLPESSFGMEAGETPSSAPRSSTAVEGASS
jgi:hypothetical protein